MYRADEYTHHGTSSIVPSIQNASNYETQYELIYLWESSKLRRH